MEVYKTWLPWGSARDVFFIDGGGALVLVLSHQETDNAPSYTKLNCPP